MYLGWVASFALASALEDIPSAHSSNIQLMFMFKICCFKYQSQVLNLGIQLQVQVQVVDSQAFDVEVHSSLYILVAGVSATNQ